MLACTLTYTHTHTHTHMHTHTHTYARTHAKADSPDQLEWHKRYCVLAKDDRKLFFYNDTEVRFISRNYSIWKYSVSLYERSILCVTMAACRLRHAGTVIAS